MLALFPYSNVYEQRTMLKNSDEIKPQLTPALQKLMNDVLLQGEYSRPLMFGDELEFQRIKGITFPKDCNACFNPFEKQFIIFIKQLDPITSKEEQDIAHELGHLWLFLFGLPPEMKTSDKNRQEAYDTFYGPLREIMEHAVYYPLLKTEYEIDLYEIGNERLFGFIKDQLPNLKSNSVEEKLLLILNYIKYVVESNSPYWQVILYTAYSKKASDVKVVADKLVTLTKELAGRLKDINNFISQYRKALEILMYHYHYGISKELWPKFIDEKQV